jgi:hypothetical protein
MYPKGVLPSFCGDKGSTNAELLDSKFRACLGKVFAWTPVTVLWNLIATKMSKVVFIWEEDSTC